MSRSAPTFPTRLLASFLVAGTLLSACAGTTDVEGPDALAFEAPELEQHSETIDVDLAEFHARWLCELQRRTFPDLEALDGALVESLQGAGHNRADYENFVASLEHSESDRLHVRELYAARCAG